MHMPEVAYGQNCDIHTICNGLFWIAACVCGYEGVSRVRYTAAHKLEKHLGGKA